MPGDVESLSDYGALGVLVLLLLTLAITLLRREAARADRAEADYRALNATMQDRVIPALVTATTAVQRYAEVVNESVTTLREVQADWSTTSQRCRGIVEGKS